MNLLLLPNFRKDRENLAEDPEQRKGRDENEKRPDQAFLEGLPIMRDDRQVVVHEPGEGEREGLAADDDVPPHHEHAEQHQQHAEHRSADRQPGQQEQDERDEVADAVLQDEDIVEILARR